MRLLNFDKEGELSLTEDLQDHIPLYAILSHTWGEDKDEVNFDDLKHESYKNKAGYTKIKFCAEQAKKDNLKYFWVDTCCINKANNTEFYEAINSMFRWYHDAAQCYVYLSDVSAKNVNDNGTERTWNMAFRKSRWYSRGWTLQELLAPTSVKFFSREGEWLGNKFTLEQQIHGITNIPIEAIRGTPMSKFSVDERMQWVAKRDTRRKEDKAYCLLGIFNVFMPLIYGEGENAFVRLRNEIDKASISTSSESGNVHWTVSRSFNTLFTGRKDILDRLERNVRAAVQHGSCTGQCRMVISGLGGQGKSEISLQLAQRVRSLLWGVFWVDVSTPSLAEIGFLDIAKRLQVSASTWQDGRQGLASILRPWMLVLDNADDPDVDYQAYFPPGSSGVVVLTSRNAACKQYANANDGFVALEGLPIDEATELLLRAANVAADQRSLLEGDGQMVASLLQSHPLALIQAGIYVGRGHCTLAEYPKVYERQRKRLLRFRPSQAQSRYQDVYTTFEASVEILQASQTQSSRDALELLPLLAVGGPSQLPLIVFEVAWQGTEGISASDSGDWVRLTTWHVSRLPLLMEAGGDAWDSFRLVEAVSTLRAFALVSTNVNHEHMSVSMHPLVHAWARDRQDEQQQHESWIAMGCVWAMLSDRDEVWQLHLRQLQPHLQATTSWEMRCAFQSEPQVAVVSILVACGWLLGVMRDEKTLPILLHRLCSHLGIEKSRIDQQWLGLYHLMGYNFLGRGKVSDAIRLLKEMVLIGEQTLAEDHPDRLRSQTLLARAYQANRQIKDAVQLLEAVVRIRKQTLAENHTHRLNSQESLAVAYQANGQGKDTVQLLEEVVRIREQTLAEDDSYRLRSQQLLATAYQANGQVEDAVQLLEKVVRIHKLKLAEDHTHRLNSQESLAMAYQASGQVKDAVQLLEEVVRIREQTLVQDHPDQLISQRNLSLALWDLGEHSAALEMMSHVMEVAKRTLDHEHPTRESAEDWLRYFKDEVAKQS